MLNKFYGLLTAVLFLVGFVIASNADYEIAADLRREKAVVIDSHTIMTSDGNVWGFDTEFPEGKSVIATICGNYTADLKDDTIVNIK